MSIFWQSRTQRDNDDGLFKIINQPKRKIRTVESLGKSFTSEDNSKRFDVKEY